MDGRPATDPELDILGDKRAKVKEFLFKFEESKPTHAVSALKALCGNLDQKSFPIVLARSMLLEQSCYRA
jgi:hypothetical protein